MSPAVYGHSSANADSGLARASIPGLHMQNVVRIIPAVSLVVATCVLCCTRAVCCCVPQAANHTCGEYDRGVDEFGVSGLTPVASTRVKPPRVRESAVQLECKLNRVIDFKDK